MFFRSNYVSVWSYDPESQQVVISMGGRIVDMEMKKMEEDGKTMNNETSVRITEYLLKDVKAPTKSITVTPNKYFLELNNYFCSV